MNQYIKMFPAQEYGLGIDNRTKLMNDLISNFQDEISPLGKKLFGLESWKEIDDTELS